MRVAVVIPWFGRDLKGGAEQQAWQIAAGLAQRGHEIEVLTTCCRSHQDDWETNHLPAGRERAPEGFVVNRFKVDERNRDAFERVCAKLHSQSSDELRLGVSPISFAEAEIFCNELIRCEALLEYVRQNRQTFDSFILLPYLYGPVLQAVGIVGERAAFQPCLHNEPYAYLPQVADAFYRAGKLLFISEGELELALKVFGPAISAKSYVTGGGVEIDPRASGSNATVDNRLADDRYILYLGRKDPGKNIPLLIRAFRRFRAVRPNSTMQLILAGPGSADVNGADAIRDCGIIGEDAKATLLRNCVALVQPSQNESFSRSIMEAWRCGRPVAAHARCLATATAVRRSEGGWLADSEDEWAALFTTIDRTSVKCLDQLGANGAEYSSRIADWANVIGNYEEALVPHSPQRKRSTDSECLAIHQMLPNFAFGDAIANQALFIRDTLRAEGYSSDIYAMHIDPVMRHEAHQLPSGDLPSSAAVIYHHSIGTDVLPLVIRHRGKKCLIYHNITPAEFFVDHWPVFAEVLAQGRKQLATLPRYFDISAADSHFNAAELQAIGFGMPVVLPVSIDPQKWAIQPDRKLVQQLQDGRTNILFVGRLAPNKKQDDLLQVFAEYVGQGGSGRLVLAGTIDEGNPYSAFIRSLIEQYGLDDDVLLTGTVTDSELAAFYRTAHLFCSMSEHEGFCVPLIEAMWFDIPVLAYDAAAVPETLGKAGLLLTGKSQIKEIATLWTIMLADQELRSSIIAAQRHRRTDFLPDRVKPRLLDIADRLSLTPPL